MGQQIAREIAHQITNSRQDRSGIANVTKDTDAKIFDYSLNRITDWPDHKQRLAMPEIIKEFRGLIIQMTSTNNNKKRIRPPSHMMRLLIADRRMKME